MWDVKRFTSTLYASYTSTLLFVRSTTTARISFDVSSWNSRTMKVNEELFTFIVEVNSKFYEKQIRRYSSVLQLHITICIQNFKTPLNPVNSCAGTHGRIHEKSHTNPAITDFLLSYIIYLCIPYKLQVSET